MFLTDKDERIFEVMQRSGNFECPDFLRASGGTVCSQCGYSYSDHPRHVPWHFLTILCDGRVVKL
jgi:hypothetical protein